MITVNLLPQHLRPIKRTPLPHLAALAVLALAVLGMAQLFLVKNGQINSEKAHYTDLQGQLSALQDTVNEYNRLSTEKVKLAAKVEVIQEILKDRMIWSEQLHRLTSLMPDNIWLAGVKETTKRMQEQVEEVDPKTKQKVLKNVTVTKPILEVKGYAIQDETGRDNIYPFIAQLEGNDNWRSRFDLKPPTMGYNEFNGVLVRTFTFEFEILPGVETPGPDTPGGDKKDA